MRTSSSMMKRFWSLGIKAVKELATQECASVEKIVLAREYRVEAWLLIGYRQLIQHEFSLPHNEARKLGDATTIKICEVYGFNGNRDMNSLDTLFRDGYGAEVDYAGYNGEGVEENAKLA
ncbi:hypothetical protein FIBSPDRAFT_887530 [Athelia psychrophila]|uniref:Uncharacterized protein n=1 Tax=Athelia psychrophila TaxID=1759441 RepID=A0A166PJD2_9AGAM|nr:hypothetical protein FIBSPDRAFT_887530 [Fibularhizoctonia sp. CBS 109695]